MEVVRRTLHKEERSRDAHLLEQQRITWEKFDFGSDLEIYDDRGVLMAITSRENPNLDRLLAQFAAGEHEPGDLR